MRRLSEQTKNVNTQLFSAIIQRGSIRQLAKDVGLGESTIRDVLKGRRGQVQTDTVISKINRYYSSHKNDKNERGKIEKNLKTIAYGNRRQLAVQSKQYNPQTKAFVKIPRTSRKELALTGKAKSVKVKVLNKNQVEDLRDLLLDSYSGEYESI